MALGRKARYGPKHRQVNLIRVCRSGALSFDV